jgi:TolA-binding protein
MQERMEGVQGWMAEIEKKQERTSRFGAVAVILAILAAGGALALGVINKQDGATTNDVDELATKVNELGASVEQQTEKQLKAINARLAELEQQLDSLNQQQRQTEAQITTLQTRVGNAAAAAAAAPAPAAPGSKP